MLEARELVKTFETPGRGRIRAVDGLGFTVAGGEAYGLLGPNGAGKTTTLRMLATLLVPDEGQVSIAGVDARRHPVEARRRLAYVPAEAGLPPRLGALEAVTLFARIQGVARPRPRAEALLERMGAGPWMKAQCGELSTGMKRRVVLARALVHDPAVLLLDEPTDGLDVQGRREVLGLIRGLLAEGRAVVLSSHILSEVERVCQRVGIVHGGRLVEEGSLDELRARSGQEELEEVFVRLVEVAAGR